MTSDQISRTEEKSYGEHYILQTTLMEKKKPTKILWAMKITEKIWSITFDMWTNWSPKQNMRTKRFVAQKLWSVQWAGEEQLKASVWWEHKWGNDFKWSERKLHKALRLQEHKERKLIHFFYIYKTARPFSSGTFPLKPQCLNYVRFKFSCVK